MDEIPADALVATLPPDMREVADALRSLVRRIVPDAIEAVRTGWRVINYRVPAGRRRAPVFGFVMVEPVHVHLGFEHGVLIVDPEGVLEGTDLRRARYLTFRNADEIREGALRPLILEAIRIATMSAGERAALRFDRELRAELGPDPGPSLVRSRLRPTADERESVARGS